MKPYISLADRSLLEKTIVAIGARGIIAELAETRTEALGRLKELIPAGSTLMTGASATLREIGFEAELANRTGAGTISDREYWRRRTLQYSATFASARSWLTTTSAASRRSLKRGRSWQPAVGQSAGRLRLLER